ncbi:hypothetical protein HMPREF9080_01950 [Cardiobacterium valvarum F0432]|uniref:Uncharacterized protein n=1 Tax=Cardiobacterium valvarum F0432 TaxID=797473 RepID=G9ZGQ5_9GAMM|nr:hypothetical protein HMPREF9080_01950 [Cardiobacterium valvarum F0432]
MKAALRRFTDVWPRQRGKRRDVASNVSRNQKPAFIPLVGSNIYAA